MEDFVHTEKLSICTEYKRDFLIASNLYLVNLSSRVIKHYMYQCHLLAWIETQWPHNFSFICTETSYIHSPFCYKLIGSCKYRLYFRKQINKSHLIDTFISPFQLQQVAIGR